MDTLVVGGAGWPVTPLMRTRSAPASVEPDRAEVGDDVGVQVVRRADLVQQLGGDGADADQAARAGMLGDDARTVVVDLGKWEAGRLGEVGDLLEEAVVAAGGLRSAFDDVPGDHGARQRVPIVLRPAPPPRGRADDQRCVGDPRADHDIGAGSRARRRCPSHRGRRWPIPASAVNGSPVSRFAKLRAQAVDPWHQVVAFDVGNVEPIRPADRRSGEP